MKKRNLALSLLLSLVLILSVPTFAQEQTVVDIAVSNPDFSTLVAAVQKTGLVEALSGEGPFTVFAPTNSAFEALLTALGISADDLLNNAQLRDVLLYHVVAGKVLSTDLTDGMAAATLGGQEITVSLTDGVKINDSTVIAADIEAINGVIHVIDTVLVPPTFQLAPAAQAEAPEPEAVVEEEAAVEPQPLPSLVQIALSNPDFSTLVAAVQKADLAGALGGGGPFTVFAPTNEAFAKLLEGLGITAEDLLGHPQLGDVLLYHVVAGKVLSSDLTDGMAAPTLGGQEITVSLTDGVKINDSNVTAADIEASNGVIHVIDTVLVPPTFRLTPEAEYRTLTIGDQGEEVTRLKERFFELGYFRTNMFNDRFMENTADTVRRFEKANGLPVDGIADGEMLRLIFSEDAKRPGH